MARRLPRGPTSARLRSLACPRRAGDELEADRGGDGDPDAGQHIGSRQPAYPGIPNDLARHRRVVKGRPRDYVAPMPAYVRPTKQIALRLMPEMLAWLEATAKEQDRSLAYVIKRILAAEMARAAKAKQPKAAKGRATA